MFRMNRKVTQEVNNLDQPADQSPLPASPRERLERAEKIYRVAQKALGVLRVGVFDGTVDAHTARRRKADLEDDLARAGKEFQAALMENADLQR
jgi:hypothetical protein